MTPSLTESDRLARVVLRDRLAVKPKENVTIEAYPAALPWATGFVREARRLGARPLLHLEDETSYWAAVEDGKGELVGSPGDHEWAALEETDAYIYFWGPQDLARRNRLPAKTQAALVAFNRRWYDVARRSRLRGARMFLGRVTEENARTWGTPAARWEREVVNASLEEPTRFRPDAERIRRAFERGRSVRLRHPNGTDLTLALRQRPANVTLGDLAPPKKRGRFGMMINVPDASVYVAVDENTAEGTLVSNRTVSCFGTPHRGGRFTFSGGRLTRLSFASGGAAFLGPYRRAKRGKDRPSFLEVGLNPGVRSAPMLEEIERGTVTVGVGQNAGFGGKTDTDFLGYLSVRGAELSVDDRPLVRAGRLVRP